MKSAKGPFRNILLPLVILCPLLWMMVGCLYVPWFEHRIDSGPNVRALVGQSGSDKQIRPFHITRRRVADLLGPEPWRSDDGTAIGYVARTNKAAWIWPLCFGGEPADLKSYAVRLIFDRDGNLTRVEWEDVQEGLPPMGWFFQGGPWTLYYLDEKAIEKLNTNGPKLLPTDPKLLMEWRSDHLQRLEKNPSTAH